MDESFSAMCALSCAFSYWHSCSFNDSDVLSGTLCVRLTCMCVGCIDCCSAGFVWWSSCCWSWNMLCFCLKKGQFQQFQHTDSLIININYMTHGSKKTWPLIVLLDKICLLRDIFLVNGLKVQDCLDPFPLGKWAIKILASRLCFISTQWPLALVLEWLEILYFVIETGYKKVIFTACHSGKLKLAFTSPNVISTSPKIFLMSRIDFTVLL